MKKVILTVFAATTIFASIGSFAQDDFGEEIGKLKDYVARHEKRLNNVESEISRIFEIKDSNRSKACKDVCAEKLAYCLNSFFPGSLEPIKDGCGPLRDPSQEKVCLCVKSTLKGAS